MPPPSLGLAVQFSAGSANLRGAAWAACGALTASAAGDASSRGVIRKAVAVLPPQCGIARSCGWMKENPPIRQSYPQATSANHAKLLIVSIFAVAASSPARDTTRQERVSCTRGASEGILDAVSHAGARFLSWPRLHRIAGGGAGGQARCPQRATQ